MLTCACGAKRRVVSSVEEGRAAQKILRYLGLPHEPPKLEPARIDQADFWATGPPAEDTCEPPPADDWDQRSPHDDLA